MRLHFHREFSVSPYYTTLNRRQCSAAGSVAGAGQEPPIWAHNAALRVLGHSLRSLDEGKRKASAPTHYRGLSSVVDARKGARWAKRTNNYLYGKCKEMIIIKSAAQKSRHAIDVECGTEIFPKKSSSKILKDV